MNVNPHLQYLPQLHQLQQPAQLNNSAQSPQISQLQLQQLQLQRQQLLNQHLQLQQLQLQQLQQLQQQQQHLGTPSGSSNPLLAALVGGSSNSQANGPIGTSSSSNQVVNPVLQFQLQQQLQQQQQQQQQQAQSQGQQPQVLQQQQLQSHALPFQQLIQPQGQQLQLAANMQPVQAPIIKEVWHQNLEYEFHSLRTFINDKTSNIYITVHQEIPGIVARPVGTFKSSSDYHFQTLRTNSDLLNLIQLSLCIIKIKNNEITTSVIWQFNFLYDLNNEMYNEEHLAMLNQTSQINFPLHMTQGIPHFEFAELMIESGLLLDPSINWVSYHAGYDLGFFISLILNENLPVDEQEFFWWCSKYFPNFFDLKFIGSQTLNKSNSEEKSSTKPSIEYLAEELHLLPISPAIRQLFSTSQIPGHQQQMTSPLHAYLSMECFKELLKQSGYDLSILHRYKGHILGLGNVSGNGEMLENFQQIQSSNGSLVTPSTPGTNKNGIVNFGR